MAVAFNLLKTDPAEVYPAARAYDLIAAIDLGDPVSALWALFRAGLDVELCERLGNLLQLRCDGTE